MRASEPTLNGKPYKLNYEVNDILLQKQIITADVFNTHLNNLKKNRRDKNYLIPYSEDSFKRFVSFGKYYRKKKPYIEKFELQWAMW